MAINQEAFTAGLFDTAYHSLAAALYSARNVDADEPVLHVERVCKEQLAWIDQHHPEYDHSTQSAEKRNHKSIFEVLSNQAATILQMRKSNRKREKRHLDR
jgi:hypothetical protein